jgi:phosphatidylglycerol---prolipoprotein diacylglyceryl transferase
MMLQYPDINPIALQVGPVKVHWYGLMYLISFLAAWALLTWRSRQSNSGWTSEQVSDLIIYIALGVLLGGRIGYMLFYDLPDFLHAPLTLFRIWDGGMSFHGGLLGVILSVWLYGRRIQKSIWDITDFIAPIVPIGLGLGRLGNFINGELWGRVSHVPWAMVFPSGGYYPRHPSQLYESLLEGVVLFFMLWFFSVKPRPRFAVTALFFLSYGVFRSFCEFFRQPDPQYGYLALHWLTMGQVLSIPMILVGSFALYWIYRGRSGKKHTHDENN